MTGHRREEQSIIVWRLTDGKRGHDNQSLGLLAALRRLTPIEVHEVRVPEGSALRSAANLLATGQASATILPPADCCLGAGHSTHLPLIAAGIRYRSPTVVLMKPSLPTACFSFCIMPHHDALDRPRSEVWSQSKPGGRVLLTQGALNRICPATRHDASAGLILLGGPSSRHGWDEERVFAQLTAIVAQDRERNWTITTSPRTPVSTSQRLRHTPPAGALVKLVDEVDDQWLPTALSACAAAWVTEDSVSMVYEALTAGTATGLLDVPAIKAPDRVRRGIDELVRSGMVTPYAAWAEGQPLSRPSVRLDEAQRAARWLLQRLP